jgi:hypothetical protein
MSWLFGSNAPAVQSTTGEEYLQQPSQQVAGALPGVMGQPYQPYQGPRIAALTPDQLAAQEQTRQMGGIAGIGMGEAMDLTRGAAGAVTQGDIGRYMDPYMQQVADKTAEEMRRQSEIAAQGYRTDATLAGAWGGGRHAIMESENERNLQDAISRMYAGQYSQAWGQGLGAAEREKARGMAGGQQLGQQVGQQQTTGYRDIAALGGVGEQIQGQQQRNLDLAYQDFLRQGDYPREQLSNYADILAKLRTPGAGQQSTTQPKEGWANTIVGGIAALGSWM